MLVMMAAQQTLLNGMLATSDMLFAALAMAVMLQVARTHGQPGRPALLALSVLFAAAYATRYAAVALLASRVYTATLRANSSGPFSARRSTICWMILWSAGRAHAISW